MYVHFCQEVLKIPPHTLQSADGPVERSNRLAYHPTPYCWPISSVYLLEADSNCDSAVGFQEKRRAGPDVSLEQLCMQSWAHSTSLSPPPQTSHPLSHTLPVVLYA